MTPLMARDPFLAAPFRLLEGLFGMSGEEGLTGFRPPIDVRETDDEYLVHVDLPGVKPEDVSIELKEEVLTLSGSRAPAGTGTSVIGERPYGSFSRTLWLPKGVDGDAVSAEYADGVLTLRVPKPMDSKPKKIAIAPAEQKQIA